MLRGYSHGNLQIELTKNKFYAQIPQAITIAIGNLTHSTHTDSYIRINQ
jgi:hypothetical protein